MHLRQIIAIASTMVAAVVMAGCAPGHDVTGGVDPASVGVPPTRDVPSALEAAARAAALSESDFWQLIDASRSGTGGDADAQADRLASLLRGHSPQQLIAFQYRLVAASRRLYTWRESAAGDLVCGSLGDDGFTDFRSWVISRGRDAYSRALADPDTLAPLVDQLECPGAELFGAAVLDAYAAKAGHQIWDAVPDLPILEPDGESPGGDGPLSPQDAAAMFPQLAEKGQEFGA